MYSNEKTEKGVGKTLTTIFILFIVVMVGILGFAVIRHIDGDTMTVTSGSDEHEECGDAHAQEAMRKAGVKVPVRCKKNN